MKIPKVPAKRRRHCPGEASYTIGLILLSAGIGMFLGYILQVFGPGIAVLLVAIGALLLFFL